MSYNDNQYQILKITSDDGAFMYASGAYDQATGATGAAGYLNSLAVTSGWDTVSFINVVGAGTTVPYQISTSFFDLYASTGVIIGGATPIGDVRGEGTGFVGVGAGGSDPYTLARDTLYSGALYAIYKKASVAQSEYTGKVGIGISAGDTGAYGFYETSYTTRDIWEFDQSFSVDTGDLTLHNTGSGVFLNADATLEFEIVSPMGNTLSTPAEIRDDPFVSGQRISILDIDGNMVFRNFRNYIDSSFTLTRQERRDLFGTDTNKLIVRNEVINYDGQVSRNDYKINSNQWYPEKVYIQDASGIWLNESTSDAPAPDTGSIPNTGDAAEAVQYHNKQYLSSDTVTGQIAITIHGSDPTYTTAGELVIMAGDNAQFATDEGSLIGVFPLAQQKVQQIILRDGNGFPLNEDQHIKLLFNNPAGLTPIEMPVGPFKMEEIPLPNMDFIPNKGNGFMEGSVIFKSGENGMGGYITGNCLTVGPPDYDYPYTIRTHQGHVGIGTSTTLQAGAKLSVNGRAIGVGDGGRLTGPSDLPYLLSGDEAGGGSQNLQGVTDEGNTTTNSVAIGSSATPTEKLEVAKDEDESAIIGKAKVGHMSESDTAAFGHLDQFTYSNYALKQDHLGETHLNAASAKKINFNIAGSAIASVKAAGVGIGSDPVNKLDVLGAVSIGSSYGGQNTAPSDGMLVQGNVGIGTTAPTVALDVAGAGKFTSQVTIPSTPLASTDAASKGYVDAQVGSADTLQEVTENGNTTDQGIEISNGGISLNDYITHYGDTNTYFGFNGNDSFELRTAASEALTIDSSQQAKLAGNVGIGTDPGSEQKLIIIGDKSVTTLGTNDGYGISTKEKSRIGAIDSNAYSTGVAILGGSGHVVSGDFDVIAGGVLGNISGGNFNFIGGGSGVDITGSQYSSSIGGYNNDILKSDQSLIGGGYQNKITEGQGGVIGGGYQNDLHTTTQSFIGGGFENTISGNYSSSAIAGGTQNQVYSTFSFIGAGGTNIIHAGQGAVIAGGVGNEISGDQSAIAGGNSNKISGWYGFAVGNKAEIPSGYIGAAVLADGQDRVHTSSGRHTITLDYASGVYVPTIGYFGDGLHVSGVPVLTGFTDTDTNNYLNSASFNTSDGILTLGREGLSAITVDLDGRFTDNVYADAMDQGVATTDSPTFNALIVTGSAGISGGANFIGTGIGNRITAENGKVYLVSGDITDTDTNTFITGASFGTSDGVLTLNRNDAATVTVDLDGRFTDNVFADAMNQGVASGDSPTFNGLTVTGAAGISGGADFIGTGIGNRITAENGKVYLISGDVTDTDTNNYLTSASFNTSDGILTLNREGLSAVTVDLDGRFTDNVFADAMNQGVASGDSPTFNSLDITGSSLTVTGSVKGTGVGDRITNNGVPYLLSGDSPAETQTLQDVCDNGNTTTTSILSTGPHISGISGLFGDRVGIGLNNPEDFNSEANRLVVGDGVGAEGLTIFSGPAHSASINFADGTGGNSSYEGFIQYRHGDEGFRIGAGGGGRMFIGANNTVGIGTLAPNAELEIAASVATIRLTDSDLTNTFSEIEKGGDYLYFYSRANSSNGGFLFAGDNGTTETEFMRIATDGDVGIGSNVPSAKLDVAGGIKLLDNNYLTWNSSNTRIIGNSDYLQFQVAASDKVRIQSDGSVGIGTTAPITRLVVDTPMNRGQTNPSGLIVTDSANGAMALEMGVDRASSASYIESRHTGSNTNYTLLLNPSYGKVGVGTSSPTSKFEVGTVAYGTNSIAKFWDGTDGVEITNRGTSRQQIDFLGSNTSAINVSGSLHINYDGDNNGTNDSITFARNGVDEAGTVDMIITEGKVGIGTTDPETTLELATTMSSSPTTQLYLDVDGSNSVGGGGELIFSTSASAGAKDAFNAIVRGERSSLNDGSSDLTFLTTHVTTSATAAARMTIKDAGNVGIGSTSPVRKLDVSTNGADTYGIRNSYNSSYYMEMAHNRFNTVGNNYIRFNIDDATKMTIVDADFGGGVNGVGIGITNPTAELQVIGDISGSGSFLGTGAGNRITNQGVPYLLSGDSPAETQTLQDVCDNGSTTTTAVNISGAITVANHIFKNVENSFLGLYGGSDTLTNDGFIKIYGNSSNWGKVQTNIGYDATNSKAHWTLNNTTELMTLKGDGSLGVGTTSISNKLDVAGSVGIGSSYAGTAAPSNGAIIEGNVGIGTSSVSNTLDVAGAIAIGSSFAGSSAPSNGAIIEGNVGIGTSYASNALDVNGHLSATSKSFLIDHPIEENKKLQYACLEGPENGVYVRGTTSSKSIELPEYWSELIHEDSITVVVTPIGKKQDLYIKSKTPELILIGGVEGSYDYVVYGERKDIDKLEIEPLKSVN